MNLSIHCIETSSQIKHFNKTQKKNSSIFSFSVTFVVGFQQLTYLQLSVINYFEQKLEHILKARQPGARTTVSVFLVMVRGGIPQNDCASAGRVAPFEIHQRLWRVCFGSINQSTGNTQLASNRTYFFETRHLLAALLITSVSYAGQVKHVRDHVTRQLESG